MMKVHDTRWISCSVHEAGLTVTDGINSCLVFSQPCYFEIGDKHDQGGY